MMEACYCGRSAGRPQGGSGCGMERGSRVPEVRPQRRPGMTARGASAGDLRRSEAQEAGVASGGRLNRCAAR